MAIDPEDIRTCLGHGEDPSGAAGGAVLPPIVQTSLFLKASLDDLVEGLGDEYRHRMYTRGRNPTVQALETQLATLERGEACKCFGSGMGAISAAMLGTLEAGDHVLFVNQIYGPTLQLAAHLERFGITHDLTLDVSTDGVERALRPETRLIWMESPGTMLFRMVDVRAIAELAKSRGIRTGMDNTWATPLLQKPLTVGVDLVAHAASKYLGGHSDVMGGALVGPDEWLEQIFYRAFLLNGAVLAPTDAWLIIRGLRTLPARIAQHGADALRIAEYLDGHAAVRRVFHPALGPDRDLAERQLAGYSGLMSFELADGRFDTVRRVIDAMRLFRVGVSWGGPESLVLSPNHGTNEADLEAHGIPRGLIRLSVGLEGADPLIEDLDAALGTA